MTSAALAASSLASGLPAVSAASPPAVPVKLSYSNGYDLGFICDPEGRFYSLLKSVLYSSSTLVIDLPAAFGVSVPSEGTMQPKLRPYLANETGTVNHSGPCPCAVAAVDFTPAAPEFVAPTSEGA